MARGVEVSGLGFVGWPSSSEAVSGLRAVAGRPLSPWVSDVSGSSPLSGRVEGGVVDLKI